MAYQERDLKKLRKKDLEGIARSLNYGEECCKRLTRTDLIKCIMDKRPCGLTEGATCDSGIRTADQPIVNIDMCETPLSFDDSELNYVSLTYNNLYLVPRIRFLDIYTHFRGTEKGTFKAFDRAVKHTAAGDVSDICVSVVNDIVYARCRCIASQKSKRYTCFVAVRNNGAILAATCDCPIDLAQHCSHIGAMLFSLEECKRSGSISRTSKSSQWNIPRAMKLEPQQLLNIEVTSPKYRKVSKDTESNPTTTTFDPRAPAHRDQPDNHYMTAVQELIGACGELAIGHLWGIHPQPPDAALEITVSTCTAPDDMHTLIIESGHTPPEIIMRPITAEVQEKVFNGTKGQSRNPMWQQLRKGRLTSSLFGDIMKCHSMPSKTLMKSIMGISKSYGQAIEWGKEHEAHALAEYQELLGVKVDACGLCLHNTYPYIGTSPDGVTVDVVVEVKCPYTGRDKTVQELVESGYPHIDINDDGSLELRKTSGYYYQVTGQMALMGCNMCHMIVWTPQDMEIISVAFDPQLWKEEMLPKLVSFYETFIVPEIVLPKFK